VFDGYRPWSVTKLFWKGTPGDKKQFVADPAKGLRHNHGCAVDLNLYDLATGRDDGTFLCKLCRRNGKTKEDERSAAFKNESTGFYRVPI